MEEVSPQRSPDSSTNTNTTNSKNKNMKKTKEVSSKSKNNKGKAAPPPSTSSSSSSTSPSSSTVTTPATPPTAKLILQSTGPDHYNVPREVVITGDTRHTVGRAMTSTIQLNSIQISRNHAVLYWDEQGKNWMIEDYSTNGIIINPKKDNSLNVPKKKPTEIHHNDVIALVPTGSLEYKFEVQNMMNPLKEKEEEIVISDSEDSLLSLNGDGDDKEEDEAEVFVSASSHDGDGEELPDLDSDGIDFLVSKKRDLKRKKSMRPSIELMDQDVVMLSPPRFSSSSREPGGSNKKARLSTMTKEEMMEMLQDQMEVLDTQKRQIEGFELAKENLSIQHMIEVEELEAKRGEEMEAAVRRTRDEMGAKLLDAVETEFSCCICSQIFVEPACSPACGHTFCNFCITEWLKKKLECPICRTPIQVAPKKHIEMENYIDKFFEIIGDKELLDRRKEQISDRKREEGVVRQNAPPAPPVVPFPYPARGGRRRGGGRRGRGAVAPANNNNPGLPGGGNLDPFGLGLDFAARAQQIFRNRLPPDHPLADLSIFLE